MSSITQNEQLSAIHKSFEAQANRFDSDKYHLSKQEYQDYMITKTCPSKTDNILEVAAGTCICGRAFAPHVGHVTCLDTTPAMLEVGKKECEKANIRNITLVTGNAEELPFLDDSFDIVISRLAFHHFVNGTEIFTEMKRVLKPDGKLVLVDMIAGNEDLRDEVDRIETLRDNSHVKNLSISEMQNLYLQSGMTLESQELTEIPVSLEKWMDLTGTPEHIKQGIRKLMIEDINGKTVTGFSPYYKQDEIYFSHHWVFNLGKKASTC